MERYDVDCQGCGRNIGNAHCIDPSWHQCSRSRGETEVLGAIFFSYVRANLPVVTFNDQGEITGGERPPDAQVMAKLQEIIIASLGREPKGTTEFYGQNFFFIDYEGRTAHWSPQAEDMFSEEDYKRAGLVKHTIAGRGWGRLGYCFCTECVERMSLQECPACGSELVEVTADQHPGGEWGIRGVRAPGAMR